MSTSTRGVVLSGATGAVTAIDTAQGPVASTIDGRTDVSLNTATTGAGTIVIGGSTTTNVGLSETVAFSGSSARVLAESRQALRRSKQEQHETLSLF